MHPILDTWISDCPPPPFVTLKAPPWILKRGGLESSGQRLFSLNAKTKIIIIIIIIFFFGDFFLSFFVLYFLF